MIKEELFSQVVWPILGLILTGVFTYIGVQIKEEKAEQKEDKTKKAVIEMCVKAVEQMYKTLSGEERLEKCTEAVVDILTSKGIPVSELEIRMLIESTLGTLNRVFESANQSKLEEKKAEKPPDEVELTGPRV